MPRHILEGNQSAMICRPQQVATASPCSRQRLLPMFVLGAIVAVYADRCLSYETSMPPCPIVTAPVSLPYLAEGKNRGVAVPGFVDLGPSRPVIHGVNVSKWQEDVNLFRVKECGGLFAYIRISAGLNPYWEISFSTLWPQARAARLYPGPYHHLTFVPPEKPVHGVSSLGRGSSAKMEQVFAVLGESQANLFLDQMARLLSDPRWNLHLKYLPPMLDITEFPTAAGWAGVMTNERYQNVICSWIRTVEGARIFQGQRVIIFTEAARYLESHVEDAGCIKGTERMLWITDPTPAAADLLVGQRDDSPLRRLCDPDHGLAKCRFHQYTNRGGKALGSVTAGLNVSRFLGTATELLNLTRAPPK
jgi:hypothetical protein